MNNFIPNLANLCTPLRPLLKRDQDWIWEADHEKTFFKIKQATKEIVEVKHFKSNLPLRIICDASKDGLGSVLRKESEKGRETTLLLCDFKLNLNKNIQITSWNF